MPRPVIAFPLLAVAVGLVAAARAADQPDVARIFADGFITKFNQSCISSGKIGGAGRVSDAKIAAYCHCAAKSMTDGFSDVEKQELLQTNGPPSAPVQQKMNDLVERCQEETLR
jgi:hypothetical protein